MGKIERMCYFTCLSDFTFNLKIMKVTTIKDTHKEDKDKTVETLWITTKMREIVWIM